MTAIDFETIDHLTGGKLGVFDVVCPKCGPERRSPANQNRRVLRIWRDEECFATFRCARCDDEGFARRGGTSGRENSRSSGARTRAVADQAAAADRQLAKARWLWQRRQPLRGSLADRYLREVRGYGGALPAAIGFLPASGGHSACMISAMAMPDGEGNVDAADITAVHLTKLAQDGRKAGSETDKIVIGSPRGSPVPLAPIGDGLGLVIAEGIEDALSVHDATGLAAWAAGSAPLLPYLAGAVPAYVECVTLVVDDDKAGRRKSDELAGALESRGIETRLFYPARSLAA